VPPPRRFLLEMADASRTRVYFRAALPPEKADWLRALSQVPDCPWMVAWWCRMSVFRTPGHPVTNTNDHGRGGPKHDGIPSPFSLRPSRLPRLSTGRGGGILP
jgi:hypothetical protein